MAAGGCKGWLWAPVAVECLLRAICMSSALFLLMASTTKPNRATWDNLAVDMAALHIPRSIMQIRVQWKAEKVAFH